MMTCETAVRVLAEDDVLLATAWRVPKMREALRTLVPDLAVGDLAGYTTFQVREAYLRTATFAATAFMATGRADGLRGDK